jgi:hypothetical protein
LRSAAAELTAGDILLLTYSGHGGQIPDVNGDESDDADETWVLYDRQVLDDELYVAYSAFPADTRIAVFSDSCHSGTVTRVGPPSPAGTPVAPVPLVAPTSGGARSRAMPPALAQRDFLNRRKTYVRIEEQTAGVDPDEIGACVVLISGCQDNQVSLDGTHNGLFTATLLTVWNGGMFRGGYSRLRNQITQRMPDTQTPRFSIVGKGDRRFVAQQPFTV